MRSKFIKQIPLSLPIRERDRRFRAIVMVYGPFLSIQRVSLIVC